jgi:hypothetical protein
LEKKEILSTYLGLEFTHISPKTVHRWSTRVEDIRTLIPILINQKILHHISINVVTSDTIPIGCIYHYITGETALIVLCKPQNKAFPIPVVSPEDAGWGKLLTPIEITKRTWDSWWSGQSVSPEEIAAYLSVYQKTTNHNALESWASLIAECIQRGADIDDVRQRLETQVL